MGFTKVADRQLQEFYLKTDGTRALAANLDAGANKITNLAPGTAATDGVTKAQLDQAQFNNPWKPNVRALAASNITLSGTQTIDGVALSAGDRVLVNGQTNASQNGIYVVSAGSWARAEDANSPAELSGSVVTVTEGSSYGNQQWQLITDNITIGSTDLTFSILNNGLQVTGGAGTIKNGNAIDLNVASNGGLYINGSNQAAVKIDSSSPQIKTTSAGTAIDFTRYVNREAPATGVVNGSNTAFTIANAPVSGTLQVDLNGILQEGAGNDYSFSGTTVTFAAAPATGDKVRFTYWY